MKYNIPTLKWDSAKAELIGKFIVLNAFIIKDDAHERLYSP